MSEITDYYRDMKKINKQDKQSRRELAAATFEEARTLAATHNLVLLTHNFGTHYSIRRDGIVKYNIYPGTRHIVPVNGAPWIDLPDEWTLMDVVKAAGETLK